MITIVVLLCLEAEPARCQRTEIPFDGPLFACMMLAQPAMAHWIAAHPGWVIRRWRCLDAREV